MNLIENANLLNNAAQEASARLSAILCNLRGPVPENPSPQGKLGGSGLAGDMERLASKLYEIAQHVGELEAITSPSNAKCQQPVSVAGPYRN